MYVHLATDQGDEHRSGIVLRGGTMDHNTAAGGGGAISAYNSRVALLGVEFRDNEVTTFAYPQGISANGGAVQLKYDKKFKQLTPVRIEGCTFNNNRTSIPAAISPGREQDYVGGGICLKTEVKLKLALAALTFSDNKAYRGCHCALPPNSDYEGWTGNWDADSCFRSPDYGGAEDRGLAIWLYPSLVATGALTGAVPNISEAWRLPAECFSTRPAHAKVSAAVVHFTSAANIAPRDPHNLQLILDIFKGKVAAGMPKTSAHYLVDREGIIYRLVDEDMRAWHAGLSRMPSGEENVNDFSIGIEMVRTEQEVPTDAQYEALALLLVDMKRRHPALGLDRIVGHDLIRALWMSAHPGRPAEIKVDPGPLFHWSRVLHRLEELGFGPRA
jgi:AmpD protein